MDKMDTDRRHHIVFDNLKFFILKTIVFPFPFGTDPLIRTLGTVGGQFTLNLITNFTNLQAINKTLLSEITLNF